jgi:hypothetical protein
MLRPIPAAFEIYGDSVGARVTNFPEWPRPVIPNGVREVRYGFPSHAFCAMNPSYSLLHSTAAPHLRTQ